VSVLPMVSQIDLRVESWGLLTSFLENRDSRSCNGAAPEGSMQTRPQIQNALAVTSVSSASPGSDRTPHSTSISSRSANKRG